MNIRKIKTRTPLRSGELYKYKKPTSAMLWFFSLGFRLIRLSGPTLAKPQDFCCANQYSLAISKLCGSFLWRIFCWFQTSFLDSLQSITTIRIIKFGVVNPSPELAEGTNPTLPKIPSYSTYLYLFTSLVLENYDHRLFAFYVWGSPLDERK